MTTTGEIKYVTMHKGNIYNDFAQYSDYGLYTKLSLNNSKFRTRQVIKSPTVYDYFNYFRKLKIKIFDTKKLSGSNKMKKYFMASASGSI